MFKRTSMALATAWLFSLPVQASVQLDALIQQAITDDPSRSQLSLQADAMAEMAIAQGQLPDPKFRVGVGGLPVDSFSFTDDPMTNISVGYMQQFSRGDTLALKTLQGQQQSLALQEQASVRELAIHNQLTTAWIELVYLQQADALLQKNKQIFNELETYLSNNYGVGANSAQDIVAAQLQQSRIDEQRKRNAQMQQRLRASLTAFIGETAFGFEALAYPSWEAVATWLNQPALWESRFSNHPMVAVTERQIEIQRSNVDLAEQAYKPQFGVEVMYAYRQANGMGGKPASDLASAYLTVDIPLFTGNRQDRALASAKYQLGASQAVKDGAMRQLKANAETAWSEHQRLVERIERYQTSLLRPAQERSQLVLTSYQNNQSSMDEYLRALNDELALKLELTRLEADLQQAKNAMALALNAY